MKQQLAHFEAHEIEEGETLRIQPCVSPVWDTAIAMVSLEEAGVDPSHPALGGGCRLVGGLADPMAAATGR